MKYEKPVILDVDYDFFFQEEAMSDWSHRETPFFQNMLWTMRAMGALSIGNDLRKTMVPASGLRPENFVQALREKGWRFSETARVIYCDSHAEIGCEVAAWLSRKLVASIVHFDAHHDLGYHSKKVLEDRSKKSGMDCDDWLWQLGRVPKIMRPFKEKLISDVRVIYPEWRRLNPEHPPKEGPVRFTLEYEQDAGLTPPEEIQFVTVARSSAWVPPWFDAGFMPFVESFGLPMESVQSGIAERPDVDWKKVEEDAAAQLELLKKLRVQTQSVTEVADGPVWPE